MAHLYLLQILIKLIIHNLLLVHQLFALLKLPIGMQLDLLVQNAPLKLRSTTKLVKNVKFAREIRPGTSLQRVAPKKAITVHRHSIGILPVKNAKILKLAMLTKFITSKLENVSRSKEAVKLEFALQRLHFGMIKI